MKILITGAGGMLGRALGDTLSAEHDVTAVTRGDLDVTDLGRTLAALGRAKPQVVIHAGGWADVDGCERDPDRAWRVNALGSRNVAVACQEAGAACCYISTDYVFDGEKRDPYTEFDAPNPISCYGASKLAGERYVQTLTPRHWIVRSSWLFGPGGKNFVKTLLTKARAGQELRVVDDQVGSPTYTSDLARAISRLIGGPHYGIWHLTNNGACSWHRFAAAILDAAGPKGTRLEPIGSKDLQRPAPRPRNSVLRNYCWTLEGWPPLRPWGDALREYLAHPELSA
ncbi:MAG: dTDP-4-dehydrorhamnose reductase [Candidatus Rokubacteria bacterium]|nr:dTDP-4-dehydrorhamnose reductase [Candidatus Rokubacteria bacterium]